MVLGLDGYVALGLENKMARTPKAAQMAANPEPIPSRGDEQPTGFVCLPWRGVTMGAPQADFSGSYKHRLRGAVLLSANNSAKV